MAEVQYSRHRLRELMQAQGRTNLWLAEMTSYDPATVARFLTGTYPISNKFAREAAKHLGVPIHWLYDHAATDAEAVA
jgi:transcriptional regulator with XRE-family HTH domain